MTKRQKLAAAEAGHRDGLLVPLDGERFRVALDERGLGLAGLVRALNKGRRSLDRSFKQTLHHHYQGKGSRIRAKVRERLAQVLEAPEDWLAGEEVQVPLGLYVQLPEPIRRSLRIQLAVTRLSWRCYQALERDLDAEPARPPTAEGIEPRLAVHQAMGSALARLINVARRFSRLVTLGPHLFAPGALPPVQTADEPWPLVSPPVGSATRGPLTPALEQAYLAAVQVAADLLGPWFVGDRTLNYLSLLDLAEAVNPGVRAGPPPTFRNAGPSELELWRKTARTSPFALVDWPAIEGRVNAESTAPASSTSSAGRAGASKRTRTALKASRS